MGPAFGTLRRFTVVVVLVFASGCSTWRVQNGPPRTVLRSSLESANPARVTLNDGRRLEVYGATVVGDSLVGVLMDESIPSSESRLVVATSDVRLIEIRKFDASKTLGGAIAVSGVLAMVAVLIFTSEIPVGFSR